MRTRPLAVKQVMDAERRVLEKRDVRVEKILTPQLAFMMNHLLKGVLDRGTADAARQEALHWALQRGSRSGRVAWQFARDWAGRLKAEAGRAKRKG